MVKVFIFGVYNNYEQAKDITIVITIILEFSRVKKSFQLYIFTPLFALMPAAYLQLFSSLIFS